MANLNNDTRGTKYEKVVQEADRREGSIATLATSRRGRPNHFTRASELSNKKDLHFWFDTQHTRMRHMIFSAWTCLIFFLGVGGLEAKVLNIHVSHML